MPTDAQLTARGAQLAAIYMDTYGVGDTGTVSAVIQHAVIWAYRVGYRSREGVQRDGMSGAKQRVAAVLDDRQGFHVDELDPLTRDELLGEIVGAVLMEPP